ncbi:AMP-binding protein [Cupriavidus nantongensis]|uniref:Acyl-CoA synthetase n=1 Tax=Cupriavidus nantongensis TaxID=1796606 RepID=A0A142JMC4_9BURK|nr:AMP-binding protein [Cupriavidus nantongensis]AMR79236.1 acyl-CoA synthetase [Cupriavidus nantongensis]
MISLSAAVEYHAGVAPQRLAVVYGDQRVTYGELADRVRACAGLLLEQGIKPGDIVALLMKNSASFLEISLAVGHIGAVFLPVNYRLATDEVEYILSHAGTKLLFVDAELTDLAGSFCPRLVVGTAAQADSRVLGGGALQALPERAETPETLFRLMYTSGTTARPKGVMQTYSNFYWKSLDHIIALGLSRDDKLLVCGPLYHVGAYDLPGVAVLVVGGMLCIQRDFDAGQALQAIANEQLTGAWLAPVMLGRMLACAKTGKFDVSSLRWAIGGGERTPEARIHDFAEAFPTARYIDAYGLTETCSGDTMMEPGKELEKIGSTGRPLPHVAIEIRAEDGEVLGPGEPGEICIRGPKVTPGYWREPERTAAAFFPDGWFRTGDVGYLDKDGFLYLTDRLKDMIISGGENIASSEVERVLYLLPQVSEAVAIGLPDERWGEQVVAVVVLRPGMTLSEKEMMSHCRSLLAGFKIPKRLIISEALPRTPSGKVLKRVLREQCAPPAGEAS